MGGAVGLAVAAGCQTVSQESDPRAVCDVRVPENGDGNVFTPSPSVRAGGEGDLLIANLEVPVRQSTIEATGVDIVEVLAGNELRYRIPVDEDDQPLGQAEQYGYDDIIRYRQSLGLIPQTSQYRLLAFDGDGNRLDEVLLRFRCYRQTAESFSNNESTAEAIRR